MGRSQETVRLGGPRKAHPGWLSAPRHLSAPSCLPSQSCSIPEPCRGVRVSVQDRPRTTLGHSGLGGTQCPTMSVQNLLSAVALG